MACSNIRVFFDLSHSQFDIVKVKFDGNDVEDKKKFIPMSPVTVYFLMGRKN